jgi:hypothetical protein
MVTQQRLEHFSIMPTIDRYRHLFPFGDGAAHGAERVLG